jgi:hypothetical protein
MKSSWLLSIDCALLGIASSAPAGAQTLPLRELCVDRPGKDTPPCIVDRGHILVELGAFRFSRDQEEGTSRSELGDILVRYGLSDSAEVQLASTAYSVVRATEGVTGRYTTLKGVGDLRGALKINVINPDGSGVSAAAQAFVTVPTGTGGVGAGAWEGGLIVPLSFELSDKLGLTLDPEVDIVANESGGGHHLAYAGVISLSRKLGRGFEASAEVWSMVDHDPARHSTQASFDITMAWTPERRPNLQLDAEVDLGLTRATPAIEWTAGISYRF